MLISIHKNVQKKYINNMIISKMRGKNINITIQETLYVV